MEIHFSIRIPHKSLKRKYPILTNRPKDPYSMNSLENVIYRDSVSDTLHNERSNLKLFILSILKYLCPILIFLMIYFSFLLIHIFFIDDYCFYGEVCFCQNIGVYCYTFFRELLQYYGIIVVWCFLTNEYLLNENFQNKALKVIFFSIQFSIILGYYIYFYQEKKEKILGIVRMMSTISLIIINRIFVFIIILYMKSSLKKNCKRLGFIIIFDAYYFGHLFFLKNNVTFYILNKFYENFAEDLALNLFKLFLLFYYSIYQVIIKAFTLHIYKNISQEKKISKDMITIITRFMTLDTLTIKVLNILTINLTEIFSWISYFNYIYSLFSMYLGISFMKYLMKCFIFKKKPTIYALEFQKLRSGCILEANLLIFLRVFILVNFPYYIFYTRHYEFCSECSLRSSNSSEIKWANFLLVFTTHFVVLAIISIYLKMKKIALTNLEIENDSKFTKLYMFCTLFSYIDYMIQFYESLKSSNNSFYQ